MTAENIPRDILRLIWEFAYNIRHQLSPLKDLETQFEIQRSIPPCFLMSQLPKPEWFTCSTPVYLCGPCMCNRNITNLCEECINKLDSILIPSPYKRGNPYYPSAGIDKNFQKFSPSIENFVDSLSHSACRKNHVYKGCALRRVRTMFKSSLLTWNHYYGSLFAKDFLTNPENFFLEAYPWSREFVTEFCRQLHQARFLPFWSADLI